jgi:hypothetical protein
MRWLVSLGLDKPKQGLTGSELAMKYLGSLLGLAWLITGLWMWLLFSHFISRGQHSKALEEVGLGCCRLGRSKVQGIKRALQTSQVSDSSVSSVEPSLSASTLRE